MKSLVVCSPARTPAGNRKSDARLLRFLSKPLTAEEQGAPRSVRCMPWIVVGFVAGCIGIAAVAEISESALVKGYIVPAGSVQVVQHLEGGVVAEILVTDGDKVMKDQPLIRLDAGAVEPESKKMRAHAVALALNGERLRAFVLDREPNFAIGASYPDLVRNQTDMLEAQRRDRVNQRAVLEARHRQRQAHVDMLNAQRMHLDNQMKIAGELADMRAKLLAKGLTSKVAHLEALSQRSQAEGRLADNLGQLARAQEELAEVEDGLAELEGQLRKEAQADLNRVSAELAQVMEALEFHQDRVSRLVVRSPGEGLVNGLAKRTIGAVVRPGETIMDIVPLTDDLVAEVRLSPDDIGYLKVGQDARVELSTYDASIHGAVNGRLKRISASTFLDDDGAVYFKGTIALDRAHVGNEPGRYPILPGMEASAQVATGQRTLLRYLLKPIYRAFNGAFHER